MKLGKAVRTNAKALGAGKTASGAATLTAPRAAGTYTLEACADGARKVKERSERNNCRTAKLVVRAAAPAPAPQPAPAPPSAPTPRPRRRPTASTSRWPT